MKFIARNVPLENVHAIERAVSDFGQVTLIAGKGGGVADLEIWVRPSAIESMACRRLKENLPENIWTPHLTAEE